MSNIMKDFVSLNRNLFEDVAKKYRNMKDTDNVQYSILNYEKILNDICDYIEGYIDYRKQGKDMYDGKVLITTRHFYDGMFKPMKDDSDNNEYRKRIALSDMIFINESFLKGTKRLQKLIENQTFKDTETELKSIITITENQYKKLSKVYRDDMRIYLWLSTSNSKVFCKKIDDATRRAFDDKMTPVMHKV